MSDLTGTVTSSHDPSPPALPTLPEAITNAQREILLHTIRNRRYNCDSNNADMLRLVELGLMESCGKVAWAPGEYFAITEKGRAAACVRAALTKGASK